MNRTSIRWASSTQLSFAQASYVIASGEHVIDPKIDAILKTPVQRVSDRLLEESINVAGFWIAFHAGVLRDKDLNSATLKATRDAGGSELLSKRIVEETNGILVEAHREFEAEQPDLGTQIELRVRPLRDRWETCGFGLLRLFEKRFWGDRIPPEDWWVEQLPLVMIQPYRGGDGGVDSFAPKVWMEAMLTDVHSEVPEVLRLAWWINQIALDRTFMQLTTDTSLHQVYRLATLPLLLEVAREVDLVRSPDLPVELAMKLWRVGMPREASILFEWWHEEGLQKLPLSLGVQSLQERLASLRSSDHG